MTPSRQRSPKRYALVMHTCPIAQARCKAAVASGANPRTQRLTKQLARFETAQLVRTAADPRRHTRALLPPLQQPPPLHRRHRRGKSFLSPPNKRSCAEHAPSTLYTLDVAFAAVTPPPAQWPRQPKQAQTLR
eukprot:6202102-Pleurochrysis_carterae.AAC.1